MADVSRQPIKETNMSRQTKRASERNAAKLTNHAALIDARKASRRALLDRQTRREKEGYYLGKVSVASVISPSRSRVTKRRVKKGQPFGRIITKAGGLEYHATKGWRVS
jgi:hypothetical protein